MLQPHTLKPLSAHYLKEDSTMKTICLIVRQTEINKLFPEGVQLVLNDDACILDAIKAVDDTIKKSYGQFPVKGFKSLLQMVYHPNENRFYKQVAIQAHAASESFLNIRENPRLSLPNAAMIVLVPEGGCTTDWEEPTK